MKNRTFFRFSEYLYRRYKEKIKKITVNAGYSCPNRDGTKGRGGCTYCNNESFSFNSSNTPLIDQIRTAIEKNKEKAKKYICYFQPYSNTYGPIDVMKENYDTVSSFNEIVSISIGTRPDCINKEILDLLADYKNRFEIWVELGLQSSSEDTLARINRKHTVSDFVSSVELIKKYDFIKICTHIILGFPWEEEEDSLNTVKLLNNLKIDGLKLHPLHIVKNTALEKEYNEFNYDLDSKEQYIGKVIFFLERLNESVVIQRLGAYCPGEMLVAPLWINDSSINEKINSKMEKLGIYQGKYLQC